MQPSCIVDNHKRYRHNDGMQTEKDSSNDSPKLSEDHSSSFFTKLKSNKPLFVVIILVIVGIIGAAVFAITQKDGSKSKDSTQTNTSQNQNQTGGNTNKSLFMQQYGQDCKERDVKFTSAPMKMEDLAYIRPLGAVNDGHVTPTDHVYIGPPNPNAKDNTYPVLMPADGTILDVSAMPAQYIGDRSEQKTAGEDHRITISHSCRYFSIYIHIHKLSDKIIAAVGDLQPNESKKANIELKAGEVVGYIGGSTFDWTPVDTSSTLKGFITPKLYDGESWKIHTVSPFDLYTGELKAQLEAKSLRSVAPLGGKIDYDIPGKLIGNWFKEGSGGYSGGSQNGGRYWDGHLAIFPDYIDPDSTIVSIGNWDGAAKQFVASGKVDPANISSNDGLVKYELKRISYLTAQNTPATGNTYAKGMKVSQGGSVEGTILLQVMPGEKLKAEKFLGKTAGQVTGFTAAAQMYER